MITVVNSSNIRRDNVLVEFTEIPHSNEYGKHGQPMLRASMLKMWPNLKKITQTALS